MSRTSKDAPARGWGGMPLRRIGWLTLAAAWLFAGAALLSFSPHDSPAVNAWPVNEPPLNHVGLWIDDLPTAVEWLAARGVRFAPGGIRKGAAGFDITFLHPKANEQFPIAGEGVLIELVQAPAEVIEAFARLA